MTELKSVKRELSDVVDFHLVTNTQEFQTFYSNFKLFRLVNERLLEAPEIQNYCDTDVIGKILNSNNEYLGIILSKTLKSIAAYLNEKQYKFGIHVYLSKDKYLKNWEGVTILIYMNYRNFAEQMEVWREIEEIVTDVFDKFRKASPENMGKIEEVNEMIATAIEKYAIQS